MKADAHSIYVTFFKDKQATRADPKRMAIWDLRNLILTTSADAKADLPWLKLAEFGSKLSPKGCLRWNENVKAVYGVEADYDGGQVSFDSAVQTFRRARLQGLIYTSPSHTPAKPRWRILCPFSKKLKPKQRAKMLARLCTVFGNIFSPESKSLSQSYYYGKLTDRSTHRCNYYIGDFIDQRSDLDNRKKDAVLASFKKEPAKRRDHDPIDLNLLIAALDFIPSDAYWPWLEIGAALHHEFGEDGFALFDHWSTKSSKYHPRQCAFKWKECAKFTAYTGATILFYADEASPGWRDLYEAKVWKEFATAMMKNKR